MRLIDADALVKCVNKIFGLKPDARWSHGAVLNTIDAAPTIGEWISVKDRIPEQAGYSCLVSAEYGDGKQAEFIAFTGYGESEWYTYDALFMEKEREADNRVHHNYHITHWMPLPEPPKEELDD